MREFLKLFLQRGGPIDRRRDPRPTLWDRLRPIHFAHTARTERRDDFIGTKLCAGSESHQRSRLYPHMVIVALRTTTFTVRFGGTEMWNCRTPFAS